MFFSTDAVPEVLAPAGDEACLKAAVSAGADAVYFGLQGFNARARAKNFDAGALGQTMAYLHEHGVKGYVTLNTLVFDEELPLVENAIRVCAEAGADAVIVQDFGVARLVSAIAPEMKMHASTQMTCTDAGSVEMARNLGAHRVILARELSLSDIAAIQAQTDMELEVFVHGALCVAYSGQCLTSEAIGGRSANRGACAQACRLPYELLVDGHKADVGERAYLLSPEDLEATQSISELIRLGVKSFKIEGRLKGPAYVAAATKLYKEAVRAALADNSIVNDALRRRALQMYSRPAGPGFLEGVNHQRLVEGRSCDHRGLQVGVFVEPVRVRGRTLARVKLSSSVALGDGLVFEGGYANEGEVGGRVWSILVNGAETDKVQISAPGQTKEAFLWFGPDRLFNGIRSGRRLWKTDDPVEEKAVLGEIERAPERVGVAMRVRGTLGEAPRYEAETRLGLNAEVIGDQTIGVSHSGVSIADVLKDKLGQLGDTPFELADLQIELPEGAMISPASMKRARRALVEQLLQGAKKVHPVTGLHAEEFVAQFDRIEMEPPPPGLFVLCRTRAQAFAALEAGAEGVYLDFLELTGMGEAFRALRAEKPGAILGVAPPRIRKPGEEKIDKYLISLEPDLLLVRGLGALNEWADLPIRKVGDFSLNVTNRISAGTVMNKGLLAFTPSFDLDAAQLMGLLGTVFGPFAELVVHHPMPLFHMEHCVIAALLSNGKDFRDCGRPCEKHQVSLRDRAGMAHPVEADVGCRNTVFHAAAQSAAGLLKGVVERGVRRFRIELVREGAEEAGRVVEMYKRLIAGKIEPRELWRALKTEGGYGVVSGSLRVM